MELNSSEIKHLFYLLNNINISSNFSFNNNSFRNETNEYDEYLSSMASLKVFFYCLYVLIFILGIAGNALVCYVVLRNPTMHTVTNIFITNLALSDVLLCVFAVPFTPLYLLTYKEWVFGTALCHLVPFAQGMYHLILFSIFSIVKIFMIIKKSNFL
jgi:neuropeptide Y receptor